VGDTAGSEREIASGKVDALVADEHADLALEWRLLQAWDERLPTTVEAPLERVS
jgi:hypothetical protein